MTSLLMLLLLAVGADPVDAGIERLRHRIEANPPFAGGSEPEFWGQPDWAVIFMSQSRRGTLLYDRASSKRIGDGGYGDIIVAPDDKWALATPWFNPFTLCYDDLRPARVALTRRASVRRVAITPLKEADRCSDDITPARALAAAIAPDGKRYAFLQVSRDGNGRIELFRSRDNKRVATFDATFALPLGDITLASDGALVVGGKRYPVL